MFKKETGKNRGRGVAKKEEDIKVMSESILETFKNFGVDAEIVASIIGFRFRHFHVRLLKPVRMKVIMGFEDDLRYALGSDTVEIEAPIPGKKLIGIRVPTNDDLPVIGWEDAMSTIPQAASGDLVVPVGVDEYGENYYMNIAKMPHLLVAGTTGSGKSVLLHLFISSLIRRLSPDRLRFLLVDPKRVELTLYDGIPHLLTPVITDAKKAVLSLKWAIKEMERRYDILKAYKVTNIETYHEQTTANAKNKKDAEELMPYIVIVIDEIADIMATYPNELENAIIRLTQMGRATGIHLIIATQRPAVNVVTGMIKANIPTRIAGKVASQVDSRVVLDQTGAEKLDGCGDILFLSAEEPRPVRLQAYWISQQEVVTQNKEIKKKYPGLDREGDLDLEQSAVRTTNSVFLSENDGDDDMYAQAKEVVLKAGKASTSLLQRSLRIGYSRAARLIDMLEDNGIIAPADGSRPRDVLM